MILRGPMRPASTVEGTLFLFRLVLYIPLSFSAFFHCYTAISCTLLVAAKTIPITCNIPMARIDGAATLGARSRETRSDGVASPHPDGGENRTKLHFVADSGGMTLDCSKSSPRGIRCVSACLAGRCPSFSVTVIRFETSRSKKNRAQARHG